MRSNGSPARQALQGRDPKTMQPVHRYAVMGMEIGRRMLRSGCRTTQTGTERHHQHAGDGSRAVIRATTVLRSAFQGILRRSRAAADPPLLSACLRSGLPYSQHVLPRCPSSPTSSTT
jgi:hypothetical protein